jgi:hypothetical protein
LHYLRNYCLEITKQIFSVTNKQKYVPCRCNLSWQHGWHYEKEKINKYEMSCTRCCECREKLINLPTNYVSSCDSRKISGRTILDKIDGRQVGGRY